MGKKHHLSYYLYTLSSHFYLLLSNQKENDLFPYHPHYH
nr:MAG TPA: hypothetical protein [Caudoviricetes sp.]